MYKFFFSPKMRNIKIWKEKLHGGGFKIRRYIGAFFIITWKYNTIKYSSCHPEYLRFGD